MQSSYDAVVIGSGFGGSVSALRLAQAGKSVLVLERGRVWSATDFPRRAEDIASWFWRYPHAGRSRGLFDVRFLNDLGVISAAGVGGGSLVYANIHIKPGAEVFEHPAWPSDISLESLESCYDRVAEEMNLVAQDGCPSVVSHEQLVRAGQEVGAHLLDAGHAVDWNRCDLCSECELGCTRDAKNTLDKTYLQKARHHGAEIRPNAWVQYVEPTFHGYLVQFQDLEHGGVRRYVKAGTVVISAGTIGTNELLLRCRDHYDSLPNLSSTLGQGISANGDFLGSVHNADVDLQPWHGTDVTGVLRATTGQGSVTLAAPNYNRTITEVLASLGQPEGAVLRFLGPMIWRHLDSLLPWILAKGWLNKPVKSRNPVNPERFTNLFAIGRDNANGRAVLRRGQFEIVWNYYHENRALVQAMINLMQSVADKLGGHFAPLATWNMTHRIVTAHPLGGCRMAADPSQGVVSPEGEVFGYPGLFVADGSVVPTSLGYHPSMTIAALAEHFSKAMVDAGH